MNNFIYASFHLDFFFPSRLCGEDHNYLGYQLYCKCRAQWKGMILTDETLVYRGAGKLITNHTRSQDWKCPLFVDFFCWVFDEVAFDPPLTRDWLHVYHPLAWAMRTWKATCCLGVRMIIFSYFSSSKIHGHFWKIHLQVALFIIRYTDSPQGFVATFRIELSSDIWGTLEAGNASKNEGFHMTN